MEQRIDEQGNEHLGLYFLEECVDDAWQAHALIKAPTGAGGRATVIFTPVEGPTQDDCRRQMAERWPYSREVPKEELYKEFWGDTRPTGPGSGTGKRMAVRGIRGGTPTASYGNLNSGTGFVKGKPRKVKEVRARVLNKVDVPEDFTDETLVAPVQAAKYLGVPPQYVYNKIYHGKLKSFGERPKMVRWGDVRRQFGA